MRMIAANSLAMGPIAPTAFGMDTVAGFDVSCVAEGFSLPQDSGGLKPAATSSTRGIFWNNGGGGGLATQAASRRISTADGKIARLRTDGVEINNVVRPYSAIVGTVLNCIKNPPDDQKEALARYEAILKTLGSAEDYPVYLKTAILMVIATNETLEFFKALETWTLESLITSISEQFSRQFPSAPPLPVEYGIWTELVGVERRYKTDPSTAPKYADFVSAVIATFADKIRFSENEVVLGPLTLAPADFLQLFTDCVNAQVIRLKKTRAITKKDREETANLLLPNTRAQEWLKNEGIGIELKERLATAYFFAVAKASDELLEFFKKSGLADGALEVVSAEISRLYEKYVQPKMCGNRDLSAIDRRPTTKWHLLSPIDLKKRISDKRDPDISYTIFKKLERSLMLTVIRRLGKLTPEDEKFISQSEFVIQHIKTKTLDRRTRAMVLDLSFQATGLKKIMVIEIYKIITENDGQPDVIADKIGELYRKEVDYAGALFAELDAEKAIDPNKVAKKLLLTTAGEPENTAKAWRSALVNVPPNMKRRLVDVMENAIASVECDPRLYRPWLLHLGNLSKAPNDWNWLPMPGSATDQVVHILQDLTYPPVNGNNATAFLTPDELEYFTFRSAGAREDIRRLVATAQSNYNGETIPEFILRIMPLSGDEGFATALNNLSVIMNGRMGKENAAFMRRIVRESIYDDAMFYSALRLSYFIKPDMYTNIANVRRIVEDLWQMGVTGDVASIAANILFKKIEAQRSSAISKHETIINFANQGFTVKILPPDIERDGKSPDFFVEGVLDGQKVEYLVKVKSQAWYGDKTHKLTNAVYAAAEQLLQESKAQKLIILRILRKSSEPVEPAIEEIREAVKSPGTKALEEVSAVLIYFQDADTREIISSERIRRRNQGSFVNKLQD